MHTRDKILQVYLDLAEMYERQQDPGMREVFLMLAADAALRADHPTQAESLRQELLRQDPHHVLRPFPSFAEAIQHPDIDNYLDDLRQKYPVEVAEDLLESIWPQSSQPSPDVPATMPPQQRPPELLTPPPTMKQPAKPDESEPLKVYRAAPDADERQPPTTMPPTRVPPTRLNPPRPAGQPRPLPRPAASPRPIGAPAPAPRARPPAPRVTRTPPPPATARPDRFAAQPEPEEAPASGAWVGTLLFMIILAAAVALVMFTLLPYELLQELVQGS